MGIFHGHPRGSHQRERTKTVQKDKTKVQRQGMELSGRRAGANLVEAGSPSTGFSMDNWPREKMVEQVRAN